MDAISRDAHGPRLLIYAAIIFSAGGTIKNMYGAEAKTLVRRGGGGKKKAG